MQRYPLFVLRRRINYFSYHSTLISTHQTFPSRSLSTQEQQEQPPHHHPHSSSQWDYNYNYNYNYKDDALTNTEPTPRELQRAKRIAKLRTCAKELHVQLYSKVRQYLHQEFPDALEDPHLSLSHRTRTGSNDDSPTNTNHPMTTLLALNAFVPVQGPPKPGDTLNLAEGVVLAAPTLSRTSRFSNNTNTTEYSFFCQTHLHSTSSSSSPSSLPSIVQEDIRIYRILENYAERVIHHSYTFARQLVEQTIVVPLKSALAFTDRLVMTKPPPPSPQSDTEVPNKGLVPQKETKATETLLVVGSDGDYVLYRDMEPTTRIVALPYTLHHKSASTLVSVSLVVFGALPLAWRSFNFAWMYPGLSEAIAISVVGTVSYGIWSQRFNARVSQSSLLSNALFQRVVARDEAVVPLLQAQASQHVTEALLTTYMSKLDLLDVELSEIWTMPRTDLAPIHSVIHVQRLGQELGLFIVDDPDNNTNNNNNNNNHQWSAIPLEEVQVQDIIHHSQTT